MCMLQSNFSERLQQSIFRLPARPVTLNPFQTSTFSGTKSFSHFFFFGSALQYFSELGVNAIHKNVYTIRFVTCAILVYKCAIVKTFGLERSPSRFLVWRLPCFLRCGPLKHNAIFCGRPTELPYCELSGWLVKTGLLAGQRRGRRGDPRAHVVIDLTAIFL